ncbi:MAG: efflux RND transporter periplasmic adaptor subunit [Nitrospinae bacterium]|nr:efflux RND transporter periplasmic adaptor subunit [Nitrospinota bacterium]MBL7019199.1 efflux RND transporter periplasmic adaptor subunit [Nitrospinaceae bacterium]
MNEINHENEDQHLEKGIGDPLSDAVVGKISQTPERGNERQTENYSGHSPTPDDVNQEEILFPLKRFERMAMLRKKTGLSVLRIFLLFSLLGAAFLVGFGTRPDVLSQWVDEGRKWVLVGVTKVKPIASMMYGKTLEMVDKVDAPSVKPVGSATKKPGREIKHWRAPMNPDYISDKPGKGPMGMDLVPVYKDEIGGNVSINPTMVQNIGVKTAVVKKRSLSREIRTIGRLTYDERLIHHIHTKYGGWIDKLEVDFTGQEVNENDVLLEIYSPELVTTQEELILALKYQESLKSSSFPEISRGAKGLVDSTLKRLELFDVPGHQIAELIKNKKVRKTMHIHSPVKGVVVKKNALQGMHVQPGMNLYMIADLSNIWVIVDVYEYEVPWVKLGQEAEMNLSYFPGKKFKGKVTFIDPIMDSKSRTLKVRVEFSNPGGELKPEMYANVTLKPEAARKEMAIPEEAVIYAGDKTMAMVQRPSGAFDSRELTLGVKSKGYIQVLKGLKVGEKVVTSSVFLIDSESQLKEALNKMDEKMMNRSGKKSKSMELTLKEEPKH